LRYSGIIKKKIICKFKIHYVLFFSSHIEGFYISFTIYNL